MRGPLGGPFTLPWFDSASMFFLRKIYLPLSRLWGAADEARGSVARFAELTGFEMSRRQYRRLAETLLQFEASRARTEAVDAAWRQAFFDARQPGVASLVAIEKARKETHQAHNLMRGQLRFLLHQKPPTSRYEIPTQAEVETLYGDIRSDPAPFFAAPDTMPEVEQSRPLPAADSSQYWLRFRSPSPRCPELVYARVHEPPGVTDPPTIIYGHGICVEFDYLEGLIDEVDVLCELGFRVVRPEAPFHGRRRPLGYYGGEYVSATSPIGALDTFTAAVVERAVLMDWCRRNSNAPIAVGGSSLGALIAQLVAGKARDWPAPLRPDALLLIMHCARLEDAFIHGSIARLFGALDAKHERGWSVATVAKYFQALNPPESPCVDAANIVSILGRRDTATPFTGGLDLLERWEIPEANRFLWPQGHFSLPIALTRNAAPIRRFGEVVHALG